MPYVASTLTNSTKYTDWTRNEGKLIEGLSVTIKGGFGLADKNFVTPTGAVLTKVTDEEFEFLQTNHHFKQHANNGFVKVYKGSVPGEKAMDGMQLGDKSSPMNPMQFAEKDEGKPEIMSVNTGSAAA